MGNYCYKCSGKDCNEPNDLTERVQCKETPTTSSACQTYLGRN